MTFQDTVTNADTGKNLLSTTTGNTSTKKSCEATGNVSAETGKAKNQEIQQQEMNQPQSAKKSSEYWVQIRGIPQWFTHSPQFSEYFHRYIKQFVPEDSVSVMYTDSKLIAAASNY